MVKFRIKAPRLTKKTLRRKTLRRKTRKKRIAKNRRSIKKPQNCNYQRGQLTKEECQDCVNRGGRFITEYDGVGRRDCIGATSPDKGISSWFTWK